MNYSEYLSRIKELYEYICQNEADMIDTLAKNALETELSQEQFDYSEIYGQLCAILLPSLDFYTYSRNGSVVEMIEKVFYVAVCEMIKQDYNRGMLITFRQVTGENEINTNRYYDLLQRVTTRNNLQVKRQNGRRLFEQTFILETGIPKNLTKYILKMIRIYWRYFREIEAEKRKHIIHSYLLGEELMDEYILDPQEAIIFEEYKNYVKDFPEKAIRVFDKLDQIFTELDEYDGYMENTDIDAVFDAVSEKLGFNIGNVLRDSDLRKIYSDYLKQVPIRKFCAIVQNLPSYETVIFPDGRQLAAKNISERSIVCGDYRIRGNKYSVVIDPILSLEDMVSMPCNIVTEIASDYYFYSSRSEFYAEYNGKEINPRRLVANHQERFVWMMHLSPASAAYIDGKTVRSSESFKRTLRVCKHFDYEKQKSVLQIHIGSVKINEPSKKYGKLFLSINSEDRELLCVGSAQGLYYRENIRFDVGENTHYNIAYLLNDDVQFEDDVYLKEKYLFDKWNGTEYAETTSNDRHSGAFVYFTREQIGDIDDDIKISTYYESNGYYVYELETRSRKKTILIDGVIFNFEHAGRPFMFLKNSDSAEDFIQEVAAVELGLMNFNNDKSYRISFENQKGRVVCSALEGNLRLGEVKEIYSIMSSGKWDVSLWENQRKIDHIVFNIIPHIQYAQKECTVLEGKDVILSITADEKCFLSAMGEFVEYTEVNIGPGYFENVEGSTDVQSIEYYIYIDSIGALKRISYTPNIWGVRVKEKSDDCWKKKDSISIDPIAPSASRVAIYANSNAKLALNGIDRVFCNGITEIDFLKLVGSLKRKTSVVVNDMRSTVEVTIGCLPKYLYDNISITDIVTMSLLYAGPIGEVFRINVFANGCRVCSFERDAIKNRFMLHVILGKTMELQGKTVSVEILGSTGGIATQVFNQAIQCNNNEETLVEIAKGKNYEDQSDNDKLLEVDRYIKIKELAKYYYSNSADTDFDITSNVKFVGGIIW